MKAISLAIVLLFGQFAAFAQQQPVPSQTINGTVNAVPKLCQYNGGTPIYCDSKLSDTGSQVLYNGSPLAGGGATFPGTNGIIKNTSTTASVTATGSRDGSGDYQQPITVVGLGGGISCALVGTQWQCTVTGGGLTGSISAGAAHQMSSFPSASTTLGPASSMYVLDPAMNQSQINTFFSSLSGSNSVFIPAGMPQIGYASNGQITHSFRLGDDWFLMPGIACDARVSALTIPITQGSNTSNVGSLFTSADIGKTFFFATKSGYAYGFTQSVWTPTLTGYSFPTATWSGNAPFTKNVQIPYGTDNITAINAAMAKATALFPLTIPTGCFLLSSQTIAWNNNQSIVGRQQQQGGFITPPGIDTIATTDTNGQSISSPGVGLKSFNLNVGSDIDATYPYNKYAADSTLTVIQPFYRPIQMNSSNANNPCGNNWVVGCYNGVGLITAGSALMTIPAGVKLPVATNQLVFPYLTKVFATVADSVNSGTRVVTMHDVAPTGSTGTQQEWFAGTAFQTTSATIPGTPTYPFTIPMSMAIKPNPSGISNMAQFGHAKFQDYEFDYGGLDYLNQTMTIRRGPASVNGGTGYTVAGPIVALNPCPAKNLVAGSADQPWPVTPTINSGDSTPSGANYFPGGCVGNAGVAFPTANANTFVGSGLVDGYLQDLEFTPTGVQSQNNTAMIYVAGNNAPFGSTLDNLKGQGFQFGYAQGPASSGQHGVSLVGPTGFGNTVHNLHFFVAFPWSISDMQGSTIDGLNFNSTMISPWDGTAIGSATCLQEGYTSDEQTGGGSTITAFNGHHVYGCEPENGSHIVVPAAVDIQSSNTYFDTANFEGIPNYFGGDHLKLTNSSLAFPAANYGTSNDFGTIDGNTTAYNTGVWDGFSQFFDWGTSTRCAKSIGNGPPIPCGPTMAIGSNGSSVSRSITLTGEMNPESGKILPGEWNTNGAIDSRPMSVANVFDATEPFYQRYSGCNLGGAALCAPESFGGFGGYLYIGQNERLAPQPYIAQMDLKSASAPGQVQVTISAFDSGTGQCSSPGAITSNTFTTATTWNAPAKPFAMAVDFTGKQGCILQIQFFNATTTDLYEVGYFHFIPTPNGVQGPLTAPTEGASCPRSSNWLGSFSGFAYFCDGGTVKRTGIS